MAESTQYMFTHKELVTLAVKHLDIHEGLWQLSVNFGFAASNAGPTPTELNPAALLMITGVGILKVAEANGLTVDAAEVNPA